MQKFILVSCLIFALSLATFALYEKNLPPDRIAATVFTSSEDLPEDGPFPFGGPWNFHNLTFNFKPENFGKLDFKRPDEAGFGQNPEWEVFNPKSKYFSTVDYNALKEKIFTPQSKVDYLWLRFPGDLHDSRYKYGDALVMVITNLRDGICKENEEGSHKLSSIPILTPNTQGPIFVRGARDNKVYRNGGCIQDPYGVWYWYILIVNAGNS